MLVSGGGGATEAPRELGFLHSGFGGTKAAGKKCVCWSSVLEGRENRAFAYFNEGDA